MRIAFASFLLLFLASRQTQAANSDTHLDNVKEIFAWVNNAEDGFVSEKQSVRRMVENDPDTPLIVYATQDIKEGELLVQVPWTHILHSEDPMGDYEAEWYCGTVNTLAKEMKKGNDSFYAPYIQYIHDEPDNQLPLQYSKTAKGLLEQIIEVHPDEVDRSPIFSRQESYDRRLMPDELIDFAQKRNLFEKCKVRRTDKTAMKALSMVIQRADDMILIPAYDAYNHRNNDFINGKEYMNARTKTTKTKYHQTFALRDIQAGEQIFISYNMCEQCAGRKHEAFGTAEMFRDYGFVEWFPQRWWYPGYGDYHFEDNTMEINQFDLFQNEETKDLTVVWTHLTSDKQKMEKFRNFLGHELRRLRRLKNVDWADLYVDDNWKNMGITSYEWMNINQFLDANVVAIALALKDLEPNSDHKRPLTVSPDELEKLLADNSHYDSLETAEVDYLAKKKYTCDNSEFFEFLGFIDTEEAFFTDRDQLVGYFESYFFNKHENDVNTCFDINNTVQMCSNFRPYHHEYMTHIAARYVESVKRVAIVGNGYSMMLHEVLKYPDIELVVNLELDQTVTRKAFRHFKVDPHFDDERVDWWFGDVAKSLLVLPESYWGSFDLVLVDLPEMVLQMEVTKDLDVLSALTKLVNPKTGVIAENELNLNSFADEFNHSMEMYYPMPSICSESVAFGSYAVDFFHAPIYDHGIEDMGNLLYQSSPEGQNERHEMLHDYRTKPCSITDSDKTDDSTELRQTSSLGVLELVTHEELSTFPESLESIATTLQNSIEGVGGFTIVKNGVQFDNEQKIAWIIMEEGYVIARTQENDNDDEPASYLGFDVQLWSKIHRLAELKEALGSSYESKYASSHKIVVGGMFGSKDGEEDAKHIGPASAISSTNESKCNVEENSKFNPEAAGKIVIEEVLPLTNSKEVIVAVFCGKKGKSCASFDVLEKHKSVKEALPIYDCTSGKTTEELVKCEKSILDTFLARRGINNRLHMFVLDGGASQELHQIVNSIFDSRNNRNEILQRRQSIAVTWPSKLGEEPWRREFLDRYRKHIHHDPVKLGEFEIGSHWFGVVSTSDKEVSTKFDLLEETLQDRLKGTSVQLRNLYGGLYKYRGEAPYKGKEFREVDYDKTVAEAHFEKQDPLAIQTIIQYEGSDAMKEQFAAGNKFDCNFVEKLVYGSAMEEGLMDDLDKQMLFQHVVGDGCVVIMLGKSFNIASVWDGQVHLDVNFFATSTGESTASASNFGEKLKGFAPFLQVAVDSQPRGLGRVVNFAADLVSLDRFELAEQLMTQAYDAEVEEQEEEAYYFREHMEEYGL